MNEQIKAIQKELGENDNAIDEVEQLRKKIEEARMPTEAREKAEAELQKLKMMSPMSAEATVVRSYIDWWYKYLGINALKWKDIMKAQEVLETDHV